MREVKIIPVERLMEIAASTPALFDDSLEVTETEAARLASHMNLTLNGIELFL